MSLIDYKKHEITIGVIGNALTWYNFALFMTFLPILSQEFFPIEDIKLRSVVSFLTISVGMFVRPLGSMIFGPIADKIGRQKAISMSVLLMAIPTFLMGFIPNYEKIGIWAPIILFTCRALQGISLGGEYTAAMVHFVEQAPSNRRGFYGSWSEIGSQVGVMMAALAIVCLHYFFSEHEVYSYAWRWAFIAAIVLLPFAFMLPEENENPKAEKVKKDESKQSIFSMLMDHKTEAMSTFFITAFSAVGFHMLITFLPFYLVRENVLTLDQAARCGVIANLSLVVSAFIFGYLSDIYRRKVFLASGMIGVTVVVYCMFITGAQAYSSWVIIHLLYGGFLGMYYSCRAAFFSEAFPRSVRCTGVSISLSLAQAIFGGLTPPVVDICASVSRLFPLVPITVVALIAIYCLTLIEDRTGKELL